jgi:hypothetical protein
MKPTHSTATTTNIVARLNCAHRRLGVISFTSLTRDLAMPFSIPCRREEGKGDPPAGPLKPPLGKRSLPTGRRSSRQRVG